MNILTVALLQLASHGMDQNANREEGERACRSAWEVGADVALFPEMYNIGYTFPDDSEPGAHEAWQAQALGPKDDFVVHFRKLARQLRMAIALTYLERWPGGPRNALALFDRRGDLALTYAKVHTCDFDQEAALTPGDEFRVCNLDTAAGEVQVGAMICFDREFPESARVLCLLGAELVLTPNACTLERNRLGQFRARAFENMVGMAMANYAAPRYNGHSVAYDGIAFDEGGASRDTCLVQAGEGEGVYLARFDLDRLRDYRAREVWGDVYRKPDRYTCLTSSMVQDPFVRAGSRRFRGESASPPDRITEDTGR
jgi:predicted amidohydrolase